MKYLTGNAVTVYGSTDTDHGLFSVQVDDGDPVVLSGTSAQFHLPSQIIVRSVAFIEDILSLSANLLYSSLRRDLLLARIICQ